MLTVQEAVAAVLALVKPTEIVRRSLLDSLGHVAAEAVDCDIDLPPFDNSAVDGFAVRAADTAGASTEHSVRLRLAGEIAAGQAAERSLDPGECIRVLTGAPIPPGADAMVMVEDTRADGEHAAMLAAAQPGDHIRRRGESVRAGDRVLAAGSLIGNAEIALLASAGQAKPLVFRRPRVAVLSTGDELVTPDRVPGPGQIRDSNRFALAALVAESGAELHSLRHVPDDFQATERALREAAGLDGGDGADVIVTSGGVSVGERDYVKPALEKHGKLDFWRVRMKPGKPIAVGRIGDALFFGLPGNPVSTMVTFELFVRPALWKMAGRAHTERPRVTATVNVPIRSADGREEFVRARIRMRDGRFIAEPNGAQGSGHLPSMAGANALIAVPAEVTHIPAGATVEAILTGELA